jgi:hypothetical protein
VDVVSSNSIDATPNEQKTVQAKLALSLSAAQQYAADCDPSVFPQGSYIPFHLQRKVTQEQLAYAIMDGIYLGSEYGALDLGLLRGLQISHIINITSGSRTVPNYGESIQGWDVKYVHYSLEDRIGYSEQTILKTFRETTSSLREWSANQQRVFVHCSAGLSRSASVIMAYLMDVKSLTLAQAVSLFTEKRGRQPACTPSYWSALCMLERELRGVNVKTAPTFDYTPWICDDVGGAGEDHPTGLQLATNEVVAKMLRDMDWNASAVVNRLLG